jgi:hypothetical protein
LKQAPRAWYGRIDRFLTSLGFTKSKVDSNIYFEVMNDEPVILLMYVDDLFLTREEKIITGCKKKLTAKFEIKDLGLMHSFLGLEVWQSPKKVFLNQGKYVIEILIHTSSHVNACIKLRTRNNKELKINRRSTIHSFR